MEFVGRRIRILLQAQSPTCMQWGGSRWLEGTLVSLQLPCLNMQHVTILRSVTSDKDVLTCLYEERLDPTLAVPVAHVMQLTLYGDDVEDLHVLASAPPQPSALPAPMTFSDMSTVGTQDWLPSPPALPAAFPTPFVAQVVTAPASAKKKGKQQKASRTNSASNATSDLSGLALNALPTSHLTMPSSSSVSPPLSQPMPALVSSSSLSDGSRKGKGKGWVTEETRVSVPSLTTASLISMIQKLDAAGFDQRLRVETSGFALSSLLMHWLASAEQTSVVLVLPSTADQSEASQSFAAVALAAGRHVVSRGYSVRAVSFSKDSDSSMKHQQKQPNALNSPSLHKSMDACTLHQLRLFLQSGGSFMEETEAMHPSETIRHPLVILDAHETRASVSSHRHGFLRSMKSYGSTLLCFDSHHSAHSQEMQPQAPANAEEASTLLATLLGISSLGSSQSHVTPTRQHVQEEQVEPTCVLAMGLPLESSRPLSDSSRFILLDAGWPTALVQSVDGVYRSPFGRDQWFVHLQQR